MNDSNSLILPITMNTGILNAAAIAALLSTSLTAQAYVDDFNADTSAFYTITQTTDALATFAFDYSTLGIPVAPNTTDGTTRGLKMEANISAGTGQGITLHTLVPFTGDFVVKFDAWVNANGPFPGGGGGSTEFLTMGVGGDSATTNGSGGWFAATGEGGSSRDYRAYKDGAEQFAESGQFNAGLSSAGGGAHNASDPYYAAFGSIDVGALPQAGLFAQQTGISGAGSFGFAWHEVEMRVDADGGTAGATSVSLYIDGLQIATLDAGIGASFVTDGAVQIGYADLFSSVSDNAALSFGLVDNLRIAATASTAVIGAGCTGAGGVPDLAANNTPALGTNFQLAATNLDPIVPISTMVVGFNALPLPIDLQLIGLGAGCELFIGFDGLLTFPAAAGTGLFDFPVPASDALAGTPIYFQCAGLDSVALGGFTVSNAIEATLGF